MKKIFSWSLLLLFVFFLSLFLFITGKQHKIFLKNGSSKMKEIPKEVFYKIDNQKEKKIKKGKKAVSYVKGKKHLIELKYKNEKGEEIKIKKEFIAKISSVEEIELSEIIKGKDKWLLYK